jgi:hypothetical protein
MLVIGEKEVPSTPAELEQPNSDNTLHIAAKVYARQLSLLCCNNNQPSSYKQ